MENTIKRKEHIEIKDSAEDVQYLMYKLYYRDVFRTIYYLTKDKELSKDLTNDAYLKAFSKLETLDNMDNFKQWICVIGANLAKNHIRKQSKVVSFYPMDTIEDEQLTEDVVIEGIIKDEQKKRLRESLEQLDPDFKEIITLRYYHNLTYEELEKELSIKKGTVKSRLRRAKDKLYNLFNLKGDEYER